MTSLALDRAMRQIEKIPGSWVQTYTGRQFWPTAPDPDDIDIVDIAHSLSMQCRFTGHCQRFYSVAEHSLLMARYVPEEFKLEALLHDAAEAYLSDVPLPIKPILVNYDRLEHRLNVALAAKFGLVYPWPHCVKIADAKILTSEKQALMSREPADWELPFHEGLLDDIGEIRCLYPSRAKEEFLVAFTGYSNAREVD